MKSETSPLFIHTVSVTAKFVSALYRTEQPQATLGQKESWVNKKKKKERKLDAVLVTSSGEKVDYKKDNPVSPVEG